MKQWFLELLCFFFDHRLTNTGRPNSGMCRRCQWWFVDGVRERHDSEFAEEEKERCPACGRPR